MPPKPRQQPRSDTSNTTEDYGGDVKRPCTPRIEQDKHRLQSYRRTQNHKSTNKKIPTEVFEVPFLSILPIQNPFSSCLGQRRRYGSYGADVVLSPPGQ